MEFIKHFIELFLESAPWLILGLVIAGLMKEFIPSEWMNKQLGGHGIKAVVKSAIFGAPLPLCSCGVIPAAVGLRRSGASKASTTSFLVSTPETGVDSISITYVLLGPFMAIVRPIAAVFSAILAGLLVGRDDPKEELQSEYVPNPSSNASSSCCSSSSSKPEKSCCSSEPKVEVSSCCSTNESKSQSSCCSSESQAPEKGIITKTKQGVKFAGTNLIDDISVWLLIGLGFAALIQAYVPSDFLAQWGSGIGAMLIMVLISIPMYICATASTPIAAGLILAGVSPGAVLVFMMAGPASNIASLGVVGKEMGKRALVGYLAGVLGGALIMGTLTDYLVDNYGFEVIPQIGPEFKLLPEWLTLFSGILLAGLMLLSFSKKWRKR